MKNKELAKRIAVAMLAAATTFSSVPAAAVFAADASVEASDGTIIINGSTYTTSSWTVNGTASTDLDNSTVAYKIGDALQKKQVTATTDEGAVSDLQSALTSITPAGAVYTVESTTLVSGKGNGNVVVKTSDGDTFTYVFTTATPVGDPESSALTALFDDITVKVYDGKTVNTATVQAALNTALTAAKAESGNFFNTHDYTYTVKSATVSGNTVTGTIERTDAGTTYIYSYSEGAEQSADSKTAIVDNAVSELAATQIPDAGSAAATLANIQKALNASLSDQGISVTLTQAKNGSTDLYTAAKHGKTGSIVVFVSGASNPNAAVTFTLKESSNQKLDEVDKKLASQASKRGIFGAIGSDKLYLLKDNGAVPDAETADGVYTISDTSALSRTIQAKAATVASDKDAVKAGIEKAVADAVAEFDGDGVEYKTEIVGSKYKIGDTDKANAAKYVDAAKDATVEAKGVYLVKVTASIANDFFDDTQPDAGTNLSTSTKTYYVLVNTGKLKEVKTTDIALADQTVAYKADTKFSGTDSGNNSMTISLKPTLTPAESNSKITWTVTGKNADGKTTYTANTDFKFDASTYGTAAMKLVVKKAGTYSVTASYQGHKATATVTVRETFKDVPATSYYAGAVKWAYGRDVTSGVTGDTFGSNQSVSRAQFITWLYREAVKQDSSVAIADADVKSVFSDVATSKYYAKAVQWAVENEVTAGTSATTFSPDQEISRVQAVTLLYRMKGMPDTKADGNQYDRTLTFNDVPSNPVYKAAITWAVNNQITSGTSTSTFSPNQVCTRAQGITFLWNAYKQ